MTRIHLWYWSAHKCIRRRWSYCNVVDVVVVVVVVVDVVVVVVAEVPCTTGPLEV